MTKSINIPVDDATMIVDGHVAMQKWHNEMQKFYMEKVQEHMRAADWHNDMAKAMYKATEVPLDPQNVGQASTARYPNPVSFGSQAQIHHGTGATEVPLDPETMKKYELIEILKNHVAEYGDFAIPFEDIVERIMEK